MLVFNSAFCDVVNLELEMAFADEFSREFGFTLVGVKPVSIEEFNSEFIYLHPSILPSFLQSLKKAFSQSKKYVFKVFNQEGHYCTAELIHKPALKKLISENQTLQNFIQTSFKDESEFYEKLHDPKIKIFDLLRRDPYIIGIVLGYGEANSDYFCRRIQVGKYLQKYYIEFSFLPYTGPRFRWRQDYFDPNTKIPYVVKKPEKNPLFDSLEEEWEWIEQVWWDLSEERNINPPYFSGLPCYVCRHGGSSEIVREKYKLGRSKLAHLFCSKSFLEVVSKEAAKNSND